MTNLLFADTTYQLRGLCFEIHNELGRGHQEVDYENALALLLERDGIPYRRQHTYGVTYRGQEIGFYRPDILVEDDRLLLELKVSTTIEPKHKAQTLSYLRVTGAELGMILNFGESSMTFARLPNFMQDWQRKTYTPKPAPDLLHANLTAEIIGAAHTVHASLGPGFLHRVYHQAMVAELVHRRVGINLIKQLPLRFQGVTLAIKPTRFILVEQRVLLGSVALNALPDRAIARLRWALRTTDLQLGVVANFAPTQPQFHFIRDWSAD